MEVKKDVLQTTLMLDGKQPINQLGKLEMEYNDVRRSIKGMKKDHQDYARLAGDQKRIQKEIRKTRAELGIQGMTLTQLVRHERDLQRTRSTSTTRGTAEYKRLTAEIRQASAAIRQQRMEARGMTGIWSKISKEVKQFGMIALGYLGFTAITGQISNLIQKTADYSDHLAAVRKTTGLTADEVDKLNQALSRVDTRTARKELLDMAKVAGKLGITAAKDVEGFVRAFDKINVALGEDLGDPEDVARKLGKLMESFRLNDTYDIETGLLKVGSAINHLGKSSTANEGYIVEFTRRMAGIAPLANLSIQDVMGMGATLDALGQTSEVSSTSLNKLFIKMTQNGEIFAKYAKTADGATLSSKEFSDLIETDFNEAFISLLRGVKDNSEGMGALAETLGDLELDGGRVIGVLGTLANNTDLLAEQQKISNDEFTKGTSVLNEFSLMNETVGAQMDKVKKRIYAAFVNSTVVEGLGKIVGWLEKLTRASNALAPELEQDRTKLFALHFELRQGNTTQERRLEIIEKLKKDYPGYFDHLDSDKAKNEDLALAIEKVNKHLVDKIVIQQRDDDIGEKAIRGAELKNEMLEREAKLREALATAAKKYNLEIPEGDNIIDQYTKLRDALLVPKQEFQETSRRRGAVAQKLFEYENSLRKYEDLNSELDEMNQERDALYTRLFGDTPSVKTKKIDTPSAPPGGDPDPIPTAEEMKKKQQGYIAALEETFQMEKIALLRQRTEGKITEEAYNTALEEMELAHLRVMLGFRKEMGMETLSLQEAIYEKERSIQNKRVKDNEKASEEIIKNEIELNEGITQGLQGLGQAFAAFGNLQSKETKRGVDNALRASNAMVIANQAAAISSAIAGATAAAASTGPGAPFVLAGYIASMVGMVMAGFGQIKKNREQANEAKAKIGEEKSKRSNTRSYYYGGETGNEGMGAGDSYGQFTGYTHAGEFVTPAYVRNDPAVINAEKVIKMRMDGYTLGGGGGASNMNVNSTLDAERFDQAVARFEAKIDVLISKGIPSYFTRRSFEDAREDETEKESARGRGALSASD